MRPKILSVKLVHNVVERIIVDHIRIFLIFVANINRNENYYCSIRSPF